MIPVLDIDPVCTAFFDDPYSAHAAMRDAGPVVYLPRYDTTRSPVTTACTRC